MRLNQLLLKMDLYNEASVWKDPPPHQLEKRHVKTSLDAIVKVARNNCAQSLKSMLFQEADGKFSVSYGIWRGMQLNYENKDALSLISDPKAVTRYSRFTENYYTVLMDNYTEWKAYPKRSQSLVCSLNKYKANAYGNRRYLVLPFDDGNIGICSAGDIWDSFPALSEAIGSEDVTFIMGSFGDKINTLYKFLIKWNNKNIGDSEQEDFQNIPQNYMGIIEAFDDMYTKIVMIHRRGELQEFLDFTKVDGSYLAATNLVTLAIEKYDCNFPKMMKKLMSPQFNDFQRTTAAGLGNILEVENSNRREVWTDSKSILIADSVVDQFIDLYTRT